MTSASRGSIQAIRRDAVDNAARRGLKLIVEIEQILDAAKKTAIPDSNRQALTPRCRAAVEEFKTLRDTHLKYMGPSIRMVLSKHLSALRSLESQLADRTSATVSSGSSNTSRTVSPAQSIELSPPSAQLLELGFSHAKTPLLPASVLIDELALSDADFQTAPTSPESQASVPTPPSNMSPREIRRAIMRTLSQSGSALLQGTKIKLDTRIMLEAVNDISVLRDRASNRKLFHVSFVPSDLSKHDLLVGSSIGTRRDAKRRPALMLQSDGTRIEVSVDELRLGLYSRLGDEAQDLLSEKPHTRSVIALAEAPSVAATAIFLSKNPTDILVPVDNKLYIVSTSKGGLGLGPLVKTMSAETRTAFARLVLSDLIEHYALIHSRGYVHGSASLENTLLLADRGEVVATELGQSGKLSADGVCATPIPIRYISPESTMNAATDRVALRLSPAHDVWALGITTLRLLAGDVLASDALVNPHDALSLRALLLPRAPAGDSTFPTTASIVAIANEATPEIQAAATMLQRDPSLLHLVMWRMLDPNPATRITLAELGPLVRMLAVPFDGQKAFLYKQLAAQEQKVQAAYAKLHSAADKVDALISTIK